MHIPVAGAITLLVVVLSHKCNINPDNVATPIAASFGDVTTLALLAAISSYLYHLKGIRGEKGLKKKSTFKYLDFSYLIIIVFT